jgi:exosortase
MAADSENISPEVTTPPEKRAARPRYRYSTAQTAPVATTSAAAVLPPQVLSDPSLLPASVDWKRVAIGLAGAGLCFLALYPSELMGLENKWYTDSGWSHGFVVPLISIFLIRNKWETLRTIAPQRAWMGLVVLLLGVVGQLLFRATGNVHMSSISILVVLFGAVLFVLGWNFLKVLWLPIGYLIFAIPPPPALYGKLTAPMQLIAAELGVWMLPLTGNEAERSGTIINVLKGGEVIRLNVEEACSGMRMLVAFFALAVALAYSTPRPMWQKLFLAACALPIAIFCNALRVTFTGVLVARLGKEWGEGNAHAYFGLLMLIPAMFMQLGLAWLLDKIFIDADVEPKTVAAGGST